MDEKEKLADMAEEKPRKALTYVLWTVIVVLAGVCSTLFYKLEAAKDENLAAIQQKDKELKVVVAYKDSLIQSLNTLIVTRTDINADQWAKHYSSLLNRKERQDLQRTKIVQEQAYLRRKDADNIKKLNEKQTDTDYGN